MGRKRKKIEYVQYDIVAALKGKDKIFEEDTCEKDVQFSKALNIFDYINDIMIYKVGNLLDTEEGEKGFNVFLVLKFLSMEHSFVQMLNYLNKYSQHMTKKQVYLALLDIIPKTNMRLSFIKKNEVDIQDINYLSSYFQCSNKEAIEYVNIMGLEWFNSFKLKLGLLNKG